MGSYKGIGWRRIISNRTNAEKQWWQSNSITRVFLAHGKTNPPEGNSFRGIFVVKSTLWVGEIPLPGVKSWLAPG